MSRRHWSETDRRTLRRLYPHLPTADVARQMGRAVSTVYAQAFSLGLKKSAVYLASPHARRLNGIDGRDHAKRFRFSAIKVAVTHNAHDGRTIERRLLHRLKPPHNRQLPSCRGVSVGMYRSWR